MSSFFETKILPATRITIQEQWQKLHQVPLVGFQRSYLPEEVEGLACYDDTGKLSGLVTWFADRKNAELVTLDDDPTFFEQRELLWAALEKNLRKRGLRTLTVAITNDDWASSEFFLKHGFRLTKLHLNAALPLRKEGASFSESGQGEIPAMDVWEFQKTLA